MCAVTCLRKTNRKSVNAIRGQEHAVAKQCYRCPRSTRLRSKVLPLALQRAPSRQGSIMCEGVASCPVECPASCRRAFGHPRFRLWHVDGRERAQDAALHSSRKHTVGSDYASAGADVILRTVFCTHGRALWGPAALTRLKAWVWTACCPWLHRWLTLARIMPAALRSSASLLRS